MINNDFVTSSRKFDNSHYDNVSKAHLLRLSLVSRLSFVLDPHGSVCLCRD